MAHEVQLEEARALEIGKVDVVFKISGDANVLGRLKVSKGRLEWMPGGKKKYAREISWDNLTKVFKENGSKVQTRSTK